MSIKTNADAQKGDLIKPPETHSLAHCQFKRISIPLIRQIYPSLRPFFVDNIQPLAATVKKKKKIVWRSIEDPFEPQNE